MVITREQAIEASTEVHWRDPGRSAPRETTFLAEPFAADDVRRVMTAAGVEPRLRYVATRPASHPYSYRVVVAFGGWPVGGNGYCRNPDLEPRPAPAVTTIVTAALCAGTSPVSEAAARTARVEGSGDPSLTSLMSAVIQALFDQSNRLRMRGPGLGIGVSL